MQTYYRQIAKPLLSLSGPIMAAQLAQLSLLIVDLVMMGRLGVTQLAAGGLATSMIDVILVFFIGIFTAVGIKIANARGANEYDKIVTLTHEGVMLAYMLTLPFLLLLWCIPLVIKGFYGTIPLTDNVTQFIHFLIPGLLSDMFFFNAQNVATGMNRPKILMKLSLCAMPVNALLNYILMYGKLGLPAMGIRGIGLASSIVMWGMFFFLAQHNRRHLGLNCFFTAVLEKTARPYTHIRDILKLGVPIGISISFEVSMFTVSTMMMAAFGSAPVAAHNVVQQSATLPFLCYLGFGQGTSIQISAAMGARKIKEVLPTAYAGMLMAFAVAVVACVIFLTLPEHITHIFLSKDVLHADKVFALTRRFFIPVAIFAAFDSVLTIANGAVRGMQDTVVPMILGVISYWIIGLGSGYYLAFHTNIGPRGIWVGLAAGIIAASFLVYGRFRWLLRQRAQSPLTQT